MATSKTGKKPTTAHRKPVRRKPAAHTHSPIPTLQTRIIFILDESGSMAPRTQMVIDGVNEYINRLKAENRDNLEMFRLSIYKFDTRYRGIYEEMPLAQVEPININHYNATYGGSTALLDAVGRTLTVAGIGNDMKNLVIINTDGQENASHEFPKPRVAQLVREREESGMWTFVFLGAGIDAWAGLSGIGSYSQNNAITYDWAHHKGIYAAMATGTTRMSNSSATATTAFAADYTDLKVDNLTQPDAPTTIDLKVDPKKDKTRKQK
jgi:uncharacterized protein YegL